MFLKITKTKARLPGGEYSGCHRSFQPTTPVSPPLTHTYVSVTNIVSPLFKHFFPWHLCFLQDFACGWRSLSLHQTWQAKKQDMFIFAPLGATGAPALGWSSVQFRVNVGKRTRQNVTSHCLNGYLLSFFANSTVHCEGSQHCSKPFLGWVSVCQIAKCPSGS